jgi:UDP-N-acetylglucosamine 2-epimerase (non-hydrolysing)
VDNDTRLDKILMLISKESVLHKRSVLFPVHPRTAKKLIKGRYTNIHFEAPSSYLQFLADMKNAAYVVTDSGGVQEETTILDIPCFTIRKNTERPVTVEAGTNTLCQSVEALGIAIRHFEKGSSRKHSQEIRYWDGKAGERIADMINRML